MLGKAAVAMWWDVAPKDRAEWEEWHSGEHMQERLAIPGFLRGTRWVALSGEPCYFVLYEVANLGTITGGPYLERLNNPTPWSRKMMPLHRNMVRSLCLVSGGWGGGLPQVLATIRFSQGEAPDVGQRAGLTAVHLLEAQAAGVPQTTEQKIRGGDATADRVLLIGGYDAEVVKSAANEAFARLPGAVVGIYRPAYSLTPGEIA